MALRMLATTPSYSLTLDIAAPSRLAVRSVHF